MRKEQDWPSGLYIVGSPIGNLDDLSPRAIESLRKADLLVAEDTRVARNLDDGLRSRDWISFHENSRDSQLELVGSELAAGKRVAYVSDAGMPGVSDPGYQLVQLAARIGCRVIPIPGPSAPITLLSVSGWDCSSFRFLGYSPHSGQSKWFEDCISQLGIVYVWFESPHRLHQSLKSLGELGIPGELVLGRELTKKFETIVRGPVSEVISKLERVEPRGEYVMGFRPEGEPGALVRTAGNSIDPWPLLEELARDGIPQKALLKIGKVFGIERSKLYDRLLDYKKDK
jgi:16S rRNA (cytidine1402-2'-O)-methyltransferase